MGGWQVRHWLVLLVVIALAGVGVWLGARVVATLAPSSQSRLDFWAVAAADASHTVAVGGTLDYTGTLVVATSNDGGASWRVSRPSAPAMTTVAIAGERLIGARDCGPEYAEHGIAGPSSSCLFASDDGGQSWHDLSVGRLVDPSFIDAQTGWAHTPFDTRRMVPPATLFATSDGGQTWQATGQPCTDQTPWISKAVLVAPGHGYVLCRGVPGSGSSYPWQLLELKPDGSTTVLQHGDTYAPGAPFGGDDVRGLAMLPDGHGYLLTQKIWRTVDDGQTWTPLNTGETVGAFESITMVNDSTAFASLRALGNYTRIYGTTDGGDSWAMLSSWPFY